MNAECCSGRSSLRGVAELLIPSPFISHYPSLPFPSPPPSSACILPGGALPYTPAGLISQQSLVLNIFIHQEIIIFIHQYLVVEK